MKKNPIMRNAENLACGNLVNEIDENSKVLDAVNGAGFWNTVVCTILQGTLGCGISYLVGNGGYVCTYSYECSKGCRK